MSITDKRKKIAKIQLNTATSVAYHFAKSASVLISAGNYKEAFDIESAKESKEVSERINDLGNLYRYHQEKSKAGHELLSVNKEFLTGAMAIATISAGPLGTAAVVTTAGITVGVNALMDYVVDSFDKHSKLAADKALQLHLKRLSDSNSLDLNELEVRYSQALHDDSLVSKHAILKDFFDDTKGIFANDVPHIPDEARPALYHYMGKMLEEKIESGLRLSTIANEVQDAEIDKLKIHVDELVGNSIVLKRLAFQNGENIKKLSSNLKDLQLDFEFFSVDINYRTEELENDVKFINQFMFTRMNPTEQLKYLENQKLSGLNDTDKKILEKKILAVKRKQDLINNAKDCINTAAVTVSIINDLSNVIKINPQLLNKL